MGSAAIRLPVAGPPDPSQSAPPAVAPRSGLLSNRNLLIGGAGAAVVVLALLTKGKGGSSPDQDGYIADTTATDTYNDLQGAIERIGDRLDELSPTAPVTPPPTTPKPPTPAPKPKPIKLPGKYGPGAPGYTRHTVKRGESFKMIADLYKTSRTALLKANYAGTKRADGSRGFLLWESQATAGKVLIVPNAIKNTQR